MKRYYITPLLIAAALAGTSVYAETMATSTTNTNNSSTTVSRESTTGPGTLNTTFGATNSTNSTSSVGTTNNTSNSSSTNNSGLTGNTSSNSNTTNNNGTTGTASTTTRTTGTSNTTTSGSTTTNGSVTQTGSSPIILIAPTVLSSTAATSLSSDLGIGSSGAEVVALQTYLSGDTSLYPEGMVTGYFGPLTKEAVIRFQSRYGITQTGTVGPITRARFNSLLGTGGSVTGDTSDTESPVLTGEQVVTTNTSAVISWNTNEPARSKVYYATAYPFVYSLAPNASSPVFASFAQVTLSGLTPNTLYYYVRESVDFAGNTTWTSVRTLMTGTTTTSVTTQH